MRILDFADGFESNVQPTLTGVTASSIAFVPAGTIAATNVQTAIEELDGDIQTLSSNTTSALANKQPLDSDLTAVAALSTTGLVARTGSGTVATRTITAGSSKVAVTNGDGVSGSPTVDVTEANLNVANIGGTVPLSKGGTGQTTKAPAFDALSPMTAGGDLIYGGASGTGTRLPNGTLGQVLTSGGSTNPPTWTNLPSNRNFILNGDMSVDQNKEGGAYSSTSSEVYSLDQWRFCGVGATGVFTLQRVASSAPGFPFSLNAVVTTQQAVLAATDNFHLEYPIESNSIARLMFGTANAKSVALSFWARASVTGAYSVSLMEGTNSRSYVTTYTINVADTWEYKTIIIPGDTSGTYQTAAATFGLKVIWSYGVGSTYSTATSETWQGAAYWNKTGSTQLIQQTSTKNLYITGVQFEEGTAATPFEYIPPSEQLSRLQRFYFKTIAKGTAVAQNAGYSGALTYISQFAGVKGNGVMLKYPVQMASSPTVTLYNPGAANALWRNQSATTDSAAVTAFNGTSDGVFLYNPQVGGDTVGALMTIHATANARLGGS